MVKIYLKKDKSDRGCCFSVFKGDQLDCFFVDMPHSKREKYCVSCRFNDKNGLAEPDNMYRRATPEEIKKYKVNKLKKLSQLLLREIK